MSTKVKDINGKQIDIDEAVYIGNDVYHFQDVVLIRGSFLPKNSKDLVIDKSTGELDLKHNLNQVVCGLDSNGEHIREFRSSIEDCVPYMTKGCTSTFYTTTKEIALQLGLVEGYGSGRFFYPEDKAKDYQDEYKPFNCTKKVDPEDKLANIRNGTQSLTYQMTEGKRYSYGIELETSQGIVPYYVAKDLNLQCVRDGSISSGEYVTGILVGDSGFHQVQKICTELSKRCRIDKKTGLHVHIGGVRFNKEFIVAAYYLALMLEKSILDMVPPSRRSNQYCTKFNRGKMPAGLIYKTSAYEEYNLMIDDAYGHIFKYISTVEKFPSADIHKDMQHPRGARCGYAHESPRYNWLNLVPAVFNTRENKSYSIEFRCHSATLNFEKVSNWAKICIAFTYFAETHAREIIKAVVDKKPLTLEDILIATYPRTSSKLISYVEMRTKKFTGADSEDAEYAEYIKEPINKIKELTLKQTIGCV